MAKFKIVMLIVEEKEDGHYFHPYFLVDDHEEILEAGNVCDFPTLEEAQAYISYLQHWGLDLNMDEDTEREREEEASIWWSLALDHF